MKNLGIKNKLRVLYASVFTAAAVASFSYTVTAQALLQIGEKAPEVSLKDTEGASVSLNQYAQKKAVIVLFWSTWSVNSAKALKRFEEYHRKYKDAGIQVVGINADNQTISIDDIKNIKRLVKELHITFPVLIDRGLKTFHDYNVIALPSTIVISEGRITYALPGFPLVGTEDMFDYLLVLAGEPPRKKVEPKYAPRPDAVAETQLARRFAERKQYGMAYQMFAKAIEKDPGFILPYVELAKLYAAEEKNTEAEGTLRKALSVEPENTVVLSELGHLLSKTNRIKEAIGVLESVIKKEKDSYTPAHYYLAYALGIDGQMDEALKEFKAAISMNPYDSAAYLLRAEVYEKNNMLQEASSDYKKALELMLKIRK